MTDQTTVDESLWRDVEPPAARRLLDAGLECFAERGYRATTTRDIARHAGLSAAAMYVHFTSKGELLYRLSRAGHEAALDALERALDDDATPQDRMRTAVYAFASWHARNYRLARVNQYELESLDPGHSGEIRKLRRKVSSRMERELTVGAEQGAFEVGDDVAGIALAILSLCIDISRWYAPSRTRTADDIGELYGQLVLRMLRPSPFGGVPEGLCRSALNI